MVCRTFFNTGLLGSVILTIIGSLAWRIIASSFPLAFMSNPLIYMIIRICLIFESTGIASAAWLLALIHKTIARYQTDDTHIRKAREKSVEETPVVERVESGSFRSKASSLRFSFATPREMKRASMKLKDSEVSLITHLEMVDRSFIGDGYRLSLDDIDEVIQEVEKTPIDRKSLRFTFASPYEIARNRAKMLESDENTAGCLRSS